jgi:hypothetical protein
LQTITVYNKMNWTRADDFFRRQFFDFDCSAVRRNGPDRQARSEAQRGVDASLGENASSIQVVETGNAAKTGNAEKMSPEVAGRGRRDDPSGRRNAVRNTSCPGTSLT